MAKIKTELTVEFLCDDITSAVPVTKCYHQCDKRPQCKCSDRRLKQKPEVQGQMTQ